MKLFRSSLTQNTNNTEKNILLYSIMSNIGIKEKLLEWKASGLGLIDLRSTELFEKFHVAGSTHIPAKKIPELGEQN